MKMNNKYKAILLYLMIFTMPFLFSSCWDITELNNIVLVMGIGIDKIPGDKPFLVTLEIVTTGASDKGSDTSGKADISTIHTSSGKSLYDAIQNISRRNSAKLNFSHCQIIVLSKSLCESGISEPVDYLERNISFRVLQWTIVSNNTAKEILESKISNEEITSNGIHDILHIFKENGYVLPVTLNDFIIGARDEARSTFAPLIETEKTEDGSSDKIKIEKTAVIKDNRLVGMLTNEESRILMWLVSKYRGNITVVPFTDAENITVEVSEVSNKITPYISKDDYSFSIICKGKAYLKEAQSTKISLEMVDKIEKNTEMVLAKHFSELINKSQKEFNVDLVGFSKIIHNETPQEWHKISKKWDDIYPNIKYDLSFDIELSGIGIIKDSILQNKSEEEEKQ